MNYLNQLDFKILPHIPNYKIYEDGTIISLPRLGAMNTEYEMSQRLTEKGYSVVGLMIGVKKYKKRVHRLVAEAFIPNPHNKPEINHKDGNKQNNHVENLEWSTHFENMRHAWDTGLKKGIVIERKLTRGKADDIRIKYVNGYTQKELSLEYNVSVSNISSIVNFKIYKDNE